MEIRQSEFRLRILKAKGGSIAKVSFCQSVHAEIVAGALLPFAAVLFCRNSSSALCVVFLIASFWRFAGGEMCLKKKLKGK